jgi:predicted MFS family arabinose efflux permease
MPWMYGVALATGSIGTVSGSAVQVLLSQIVSQARLLDAHAMRTLASSGADVAGPALAGLVISLFNAPSAIVLVASFATVAAALLWRIDVIEATCQRAPGGFFSDLSDGVRFIFRNRLLLALALTAAVWQLAYHVELSLHILYATEHLRLAPSTLALAYTGVGLATILASSHGGLMARKVGPGRMIAFGCCLCGIGWLAIPFASSGTIGAGVFLAGSVAASAGAVMLFINLIAIRQAVTPEHLRGRMTGTMRWLMLLPAGPGAMLGGWLGEQVGMRPTIAFSGFLALCLALVLWRLPLIGSLKALPVSSDARPI